MLRLGLFIATFFFVAPVSAQEMGPKHFSFDEVSDGETAALCFAHMQSEAVQAATGGRKKLLEGEEEIGFVEAQLSVLWLTRAIRSPAMSKTRTWAWIAYAEWQQKTLSKHGLFQVVKRCHDDVAGDIIGMSETQLKGMEQEAKALIRSAKARSQAASLARAKR